MYTMKKAFHYDFLPTKAVEEAAAARGIPYQVARTLVEIRDSGPPPKMDPSNPWQIRKCITKGEVINGKLMLPHQITFEYVFRFWGMDICNHVIAGHKSYVVIFDYTDEDVPKRFQSENIFLEGGPNDTYFLGWMDVVRSRVVSPGDEVGLFWERNTGIFGLKLLRKGNPVQVD
ncbi:hypothetical protein ACOSP7_012277 [Xanthoceras sorbifolium]|uniref:Uncharacterized protein n=1 Tax=Xanthoceras sorbifolium TaxID=99658 RepID=A0ABQ8HXN0_9ROSI|nr:hypothetical protein JRO89_XS06G0096800 [Xanthoceras sorbifolium]